MELNIENIDWPSWISAISAMIAVFVSIAVAIKAKAIHVEYALVSSDGKVLSHKGFKAYGLNVIRSTVPISEDRKSDLVPEYIIQFSKVPDYFEITTKEGAVVLIEQQSPLEFNLRFVNAGFGSMIVESNFKIQAY